MSSLTTCIKKAGAHLRAEDKAAILAASRKYRKEGLSASEAGVRAVQDQIAAVRGIISGEVPATTVERAPEPARTFKSRKAAEAERDALGNEHKLHKIKGGFILRRKTDKEMAAEARNGRRLAAGASGKRSLLTVIAAGGGLNLKDRADTIGEGNRNVGGKMLFTREGKSIHQWAEELHEGGWMPVDESEAVGWLQHAIADEYAGRATHYQMSDEESLAKQVEAARGDEPDPLAPFDMDELDDAGYAAASPDVQAATEELLAAAEVLGIDTEALREDAARATAEDTQEAYHAEVQRLARDAIEAAGRNAQGADTGAAGRGGEDRVEVAGGQGQEGLTLEAQDADSLRAKTEREARAASAEKAEQKRLEDKAKADAQRGEFALTGSDRAADVAAAQGQGDIFADPAVSGNEPAAKIEDIGEKAETRRDAPAMPSVAGIPRQLAQDAHAGTSHVPETRAGPAAEYGIAREGGEAQNASYETDLFGNPLPEAARANRPTGPGRRELRGNVQPEPGVPADTQAPPGDYYAQTVVGVVTQRKLGSSKILTPHDAAQATQYLYESAVERLDGIVTDKDGKPLAVVGGFKGALSQASVYPATLMGEAIRVPGAARIWFSHNHPSGAAVLSRDDERLGGVLSDVFRGSGIEPMGLLAIGGDEFGFCGPNPGDWALSPQPISASTTSATVPVIERLATRPAQKKAAINSPDQAKAAAVAYYNASGGPGLMLLDAQHGISAWVPISKTMEGRLRGTGGLNAIYRAVSESNAGAAIIVHGGELTQEVGPDIKAPQNIAAALVKLDVRALDIINAKTGESAAERGGAIADGPVYSRQPDRVGPNTTAALRSALESELGADTVAALEDAGLLTIADRPAANMPADVAGVTQNGRIGLYSANTAPGSVAVALHEGLHATLRQTIGDEAFDALMARMPALVAGNRAFFSDARIPIGTPAAALNSERASYAVEAYQLNREAMPAGVRKWVQDLIAAIKVGLGKALQAAGVGLKLRVTLLSDAAVLHKMARDGLRAMAREQGASRDLAPAFSRTETVQNEQMPADPNAPGEGAGLSGADKKAAALTPPLLAAGRAFVSKVETGDADVFHVGIVNQTIGNNGDFDATNPDIRYSIADSIRNAGGGPQIVGQTGRQYTPAQKAAMRNVGFEVDKPTLETRVKELWRDAGKKLAQGLADQFAPVKDLSKDAYALLRLSKGASGAFETLLQGGKLKLTDNVYDFDETSHGGVVESLLTPLQGEHHDFFRWVAANRAERLTAEGREHLFTPADIQALKTLADGTMAADYTLQTGPRAGQTTRDRTLVYADAQRVFSAFNKNVLDMAEQSGLIDGASRAVWERDFYVPFYRVADDGGIAGVNVKSGAVRQEAFKTLKGGKNALNADLLDNTLMNWSHLLDAAAKNRGAKATLEAAVNAGIAVESTESAVREMSKAIQQKNGVVWVMDGGKKRFFLVGDPYVLSAITALEYAGMRNPVMNAMGAMKHALTVGVTASPFFKIRNLIRDSVQAIGTSELGYNAAANVAQGWKLTDPKSDEYFRLLAGGGTIHFGTMLEGGEAKRVQALVESGVAKATILDSEHKVKAFYRQYMEPAITAYNELGNRGEAVNRASLYDQLRKQGVSHAEASLQARDLMDFSMQGTFTSIRFLTQVVPFFNARIQGLYKLGRAAKEDPAKIGTVLGATAVASLSLLLAFSDDEDWKKREDWDRNNYWWFKFGGTAFRIPKPFEIGAIATLAERGFELAFDKEMTGTRFREQVLTLLGDNLSMNPIPQLVKPMLDVYANKNSFTGRPIETLGMERLAPQYRFNESTSMAARGVSTAMNAATGLVGAEALSPVQVDAMLRGYFGWLGSFVVGAGDALARPATGQAARPSIDVWKMATGGMVSDLRDAPSRYVSEVYKQAKEMEQAYGTWKMLIAEGKGDEAREFYADHREAIVGHKSVERIKRTESQLNQRIRAVEQGDLDADAKRAQIRTLQAMKDRAARQLIQPGG